MLTAIAPAALAVPPVAIFGLVVGVGLLWLASSKRKSEEQPTNSETPAPSVSPEVAAVSQQVARSLATGKRLTREDLAEALAYGAKRLTRKEAVAALEALGFRKTSAYKALAEDGKFASLIEFTPDGLIEWKG